MKTSKPRRSARKLVLFPEHIVEQSINLGQRTRLQASVHLVELEHGATALVRKRAVVAPDRAVVLLTHGFAQNCHAWHVRGRSLHNYLADAGFDTFAIDLRGVGRSRPLGARRPTSFREYVEIDLARAIKRIAAITQRQELFLVGHSMGAAISCSVAGLHPQRIRGVVSLAGLYGFGNHNRTLKAVTGAALAFCRLMPMPRHFVVPTNWVGKVLSATRVAFNAPTARLLPLQAWAPGSVEDPILREYLKRSFEPSTMGIVERLAGMAYGRGFEDAQGCSYFDRFERSGVPLLVIAGSRDALISVADVVRCFERAEVSDKQCVIFSEGRRDPKMGHVDLIIGKAAPTTTWPLIRDWLSERC